MSKDTSNLKNKRSIQTRDRSVTDSRRFDYKDGKFYRKEIKGIENIKLRTVKKNSRKRSKTIKSKRPDFDDIKKLHKSKEKEKNVKSAEKKEEEKETIIDKLARPILDTLQFFYENSVIFTQ